MEEIQKALRVIVSLKVKRKELELRNLTGWLTLEGCSEAGSTRVEKMANYGKHL